MTFREFVFCTNPKKRKLTSIVITVTSSLAISISIIYGLGVYGLGLFILMPTFIGALSSMLVGFESNISRKEAVIVGWKSMLIIFVCLMAFALEGLICLMMASPIAFFFSWIGSIIGFLILQKGPGKAMASLVLLFTSIPLMSLIEREKTPELNSVITSIEINTSPENVWKQVIEFPRLEEPNEWIFKAGISYPIDATISGSGTNAVRYCNFNTGSFVEPITIWKAPEILKFDVLSQPVPMQELSFWDVNAPHLHDYFVSKKGQFRLKRLANGNTLLEGTTWYYHNIFPTFYWKIWSDYIIHKIHKRVLVHIKLNAEARAENVKANF
jgi:hypothetical protein